MPRKRNHIDKDARLAAALLALGTIPYNHAKAMGETNFLSLFAFDHNVLHSHDGTDAFFNLMPMNIIEHRKKTATIDIPRAAKAKRLAAAHAALKTYLATGEKPPLPARRSRSIPKHADPWPKGRKMQSRGFERRAP